MKKTKKIKDRFKKWILADTSKSFWHYTIIALFFGMMLLPTGMYFISMMQVGLIMPELDVNQTEYIFENASQKIADAYMDLARTGVELGQSISAENPLLGKITNFMIGLFMYLIIIAVLWIGLEFVRMLIRDFIFKKKRRKK